MPPTPDPPVCEYCGKPGPDVKSLVFPDHSRGWCCKEYGCVHDWVTDCLEIKGDLDRHAKRDEENNG